MKEDLLKIIKERGLLIDREIYECLNELSTDVAKNLLELLERASGNKMITRQVLSKNISYAYGDVFSEGKEDTGNFDRFCLKLGLSLEFVREKKSGGEDSEILNKSKKIDNNYRIFYSETKTDKKLEVKDFTGYFRARFQQLQRILMQRAELQKNLVSINKISSQRSSLSIIGIVSEKRTTKNKNLIIKLEDLTGEISVLAKADSEAFPKAEELLLDDVVGIRASGNSDMLFVREIYFPDCFIHEKTRFDEDISIAFLSDVHCGSDRHLGNSFMRFLEWINSDDKDAKKIKYLFFVGDNVDGVGIFPGQENVLNLKSMEEQYSLLASYLRQIPKHIVIFMCPGQHDAVRVAEPQPAIGIKYARELCEIGNLILVSNPSLVKLNEGEKEFKILMYHGASIHSFINEIKELRELKAHGCPAKAVRHMLKRRHLAPTHSEVVYIPNADIDPLIISEVPNVLATGEVHRLDIEDYHGVLIITGSCWQAQTPFEEKIGNVPDPGKVPVLNLKSGEIKIFDFLGEEGFNYGNK